jgi:hypothetical protein
MFDPVIIHNYGKIIREAEWDKKIILVELSGKKIGNKVMDARVARASTPRQRT